MIEKFNEYSLNEQKSSDLNPSLPYNRKYPFICVYKNRTPDPGPCYIIMIDFEKKNVSCTNGMYRYSPNFNEIEMYKFTLKTEEDGPVYTKMNF